MSTRLLSDLISQLLSPDFYGLPEETQIELIQTHISWVILTPELVYKWKKPVDFGFVNFSTIERRKHFCEEELRLNRRLCPEIYQKLVWLSEGPEVSFNGAGIPIDFGIQMVRMPEDRMMGKVIASNQLTNDHIDALLNELIPFYNHAESGEAISRNGSVSAVSKIIHDNFRETADFVGTKGLPEALFLRIKDYALNFLGQDTLFSNRVNNNLIRDCHGDLHSGNICLTEKPYIFDCIEFNPNLRYIDIAADIAFLAMDLDYNNLAQLSSRFIDGYVTATGDEGAMELLQFYKCYRAYVRGKVALLTTLNPAMSALDKENLEQKAKSYFTLAARYADKSL